MLCVLLLVYHSAGAVSSELLSRHRRTWITDSFSITEGHPGPFPFKLGTIELDREYPVFFELHGQGLEKEPKNVLSIDKETGTVFVHKPVDYEMYPLLMLHFEARKADLSLDTKLGVEISILDINDNAPSFPLEVYHVSVSEDEEQGKRLVTVLAYDRDKAGTSNATFSYRVKSVTPALVDSEMYVEESGTISFKGCLDHEAAVNVAVVIEAHDHGEVVSLSNTTTVLIHIDDSNDNPPTISGQTGSLKVKESSNGSVIVRLHVTDLDTRHSPAWRARFTLHGNEDGHFGIETDPETNDGILTVVKPLDYETGDHKNLSITVENELPYFICKVTERTPSGLWKVEHIKGDDAGAPQPHTVKLTIQVEDVNEPPIFGVTVKTVTVKENSPTGAWIQTVTAVDNDSSHGSEFEYLLGHDPAGWMKVDPKTGNITTVKPVDRESPHVVDGVYTVIVLARDKGEPPLTGTSTLLIHVMDQNDNIPQPEVQDLDVCLFDSSIPTNITAFDPDGSPFGGPFTFELLGDVKGKWKLNPSHGFTAGLQKGPDVFAGPTTIGVRITDMQGQSGVYNLSVVVCDCIVEPNCRTRRGTAATAGFGALGIVFASVLLLLILLLMAVFCSNKIEFTDFDGPPPGQTLLESNTEVPGTDCKVHDGTLSLTTSGKSKTPYMPGLYGVIQVTDVSSKEVKHSQMNGHLDSRMGNRTGTMTRLQTGASTRMVANHFASNEWHQHHQNQHEQYQNQHQHEQYQNQHQHEQYQNQHQHEQYQNQHQHEQYQNQHQHEQYQNQHQHEQYQNQHQHHYNSLQKMCSMNSPTASNSSKSMRTLNLPSLIQRRLAALQATEVYLADDWLHQYADEGDLDGLTQADDIISPDRHHDHDGSFQSTLQDLGPKFSKLASICKPPEGVSAKPI